MLQHIVIGVVAPTYTSGNLASAYLGACPITDGSGQDGWLSYGPALTVADSGVTGQGQAVHNTDGTDRHAWIPVTTTGNMIVETSMRFLTLSSDTSSYGINVIGREGVDGQSPNSWDVFVSHDSTGWSVRNFDNLSGFENITGNFTPTDNKIDVQLTANLANRTFNIYVQSGSSSWTNTLPAYWTTGANGTPMTGMMLDIGASTPGSVWVDDVLIQSVVPEPSIVMLLGIGGLLLCRIRWKTAYR